MPWQSFEMEAMKRFDDLQAQVQAVALNLQTCLTNQQITLGMLQTMQAVLNAMQLTQQAMQTTQQVILTKETSMSKEMDDLTAQVTRVEGAADSAISLITGLSDYIKANAGNPAAMAQLATDLAAKADAIGVAVEANQPPA